MKIGLAFLIAALVLAGCLETGTQKDSNATNDSASMTLIQANTTNNSPITENKQNNQSEKKSLEYFTEMPNQSMSCRIVEGQTTQTFLLDKTRYAYELSINGTLTAQIVFQNNELFASTHPSEIENCAWISFTRSELEKANALGTILVLPPEELVKRIPKQACTATAMLERSFAVPIKSCAAKDYLNN